MYVFFVVFDFQNWLLCFKRSWIYKIYRFDVLSGLKFSKFITAMFNVSLIFKIYCFDVLRDLWFSKIPRFEVFNGLILKIDRFDKFHFFQQTLFLTNRYSYYFAQHIFSEFIKKISLKSKSAIFHTCMCSCPCTWMWT